MTSKQTTGQAQDAADARVSEVYRDLAVERPPASLNERVLREARAHAGSGYSYWMVWLRPMAWVATVGLCLAIVVELTRVPVPDGGRIGDPPALGAAASDASEAQGPDDARTTVDESRQQVPAQKLEADDLSPKGSAPATLAAPPPSERRDEPARRAAEPSADEPGSSADGGIFNVTDAAIVEEAKEMARMREGPGREAAAAGALRSVATPAEAGTTEAQPCDDEARSTPESWIECILEIERRGGNAHDEREKLKAAFPDAELP